MEIIQCLPLMFSLVDNELAMKTGIYASITAVRLRLLLHRLTLAMICVIWVKNKICIVIFCEHSWKKYSILFFCARAVKIHPTATRNWIIKQENVIKLHAAYKEFYFSRCQHKSNASLSCMNMLQLQSWYWSDNQGTWQSVSAGNINVEL
jgi:hypothetical protein